MVNLLSKIWFPLALVGMVTGQMATSHRDVETDYGWSIEGISEPEDLIDTVVYQRAGYRKFWTEEEKNGTFVIADSLLSKDDVVFGEEEEMLALRPLALDTLIAPDSLLLIDTFKYKYYAAIKDSLCHRYVRDSLISSGDSLDYPRIDSLYALDSTALAKAAYWAWYESLDRKERKKADFERMIPVKQAHMDSVKNAREEIQSIKDSITENTPRILETYVFKDSMLYQRILKWTHERDFHNITLTPEDTSSNYRFYDYPAFRNDVNTVWLGVAGSPTQYFDFSKRKSENGVSFYDALESWTFSPSSLVMYNTKTPYTEFGYSGTLLSVKNKESDNVHILTTQNITPSFNFRLSYDRYGGEGILENEATKNKTAVVAANYLGKKYLMHAGYIYNMSSRKENGGVSDLSMIRDTLIESREVPINLKDANSHVKRNTFFLDQQYRIPFYFIEKLKNRKATADTLAFSDSLAVADSLLSGGLQIPVADSTKEDIGSADSLKLDDTKITTAFIGHSSELSTFRRIYQDNITSDTEKQFYNNIFNYNPKSSYDSMRVRKFENKVFLRLQPWSDESIVSKLDVGIGNRLMNYTTFDHRYLRNSPNYNWNSTYLYAGVEGKAKKFLEWDARGKYVFLGNEINDFYLGANARINLFPFRKEKTSPLSIYAHFETSLTEPEYYVQHLYTNHFKWDNEFGKISKTNISGGISIPRWKLGAEVNNNLLANSIYYGTDAFVRQNTSAVNVLSVSLYKNLALGILHLDHKLLFQTSSDQDVVPVPTLAANFRYYIQFHIGIEDALQMQIGANVWYNTLWYMPAYNPALGVFYNQKQNEYGNAPFADVFVNMQWKRACIFVKLENANRGWPMDYNDYFSADRYIRTTRVVKFGIYWPFYTQVGKPSKGKDSKE